MTPEQFAYWLQGYAELNCSAPNEEQWEIIKAHLNLVFMQKSKDLFNNLPKYIPVDSPTPFKIPDEGPVC